MCGSFLKCVVMVETRFRMVVFTQIERVRKRLRKRNFKIEQVRKRPRKRDFTKFQL